LLVYSVKTRVIHPRDDLVELAISCALKSGNPIRDSDIVVFSAKVVGTAQGRLVDLTKVVPSKEALDLTSRYNLEPSFAEQVVNEADLIIGGVDHAVLTLKRGILVPNAGVDQSNAPIGYASLWPSDPQASAEEMYKEFKDRDLNVGVLIIDSWILPLRIGSSAVALGVAGFIPVVDLRGTVDLFGREMRLKRVAVADNIASSSNFVMGETLESTPIAVVREAPVVFEVGHKADELIMPADECLIMKSLRKDLTYAIMNAPVASSNLKADTL